MARLIGLRPVSLPRGTLNNMARNIMMLFLRWLRLPMFACFFLWLLCAHDPFFNWISRMSSFMLISLRRLIWSSRLVLLPRRESGLVCKLCHSLYGLKQSPRAWFSRFSSVVQEFGMIRSITNHSIFYHHTFTG